jgi:hypothetical protein
MALDLKDKLRWDQTSTDVNAWVVMPKGTRARDVQVSARGTASAVLVLAEGGHGPVALWGRMQL